MRIVLSVLFPYLFHISEFKVSCLKYFCKSSKLLQFPGYPPVSLAIVVLSDEQLRCPATAITRHSCKWNSVLMDPNQVDWPACPLAPPLKMAVA